MRIVVPLAVMVLVAGCGAEKNADRAAAKHLSEEAVVSAFASSGIQLGPAFGYDNQGKDIEAFLTSPDPNLAQTLDVVVWRDQETADRQSESGEGMTPGGRGTVVQVANVAIYPPKHLRPTRQQAVDKAVAQLRSSSD